MPGRAGRSLTFGAFVCSIRELLVQGWRSGVAKYQAARRSSFSRW